MVLGKLVFAAILAFVGAVPSLADSVPAISSDLTQSRVAPAPYSPCVLASDYCPLVSIRDGACEGSWASARPLGARARRVAKYCTLATMIE
jgi:hypothetical protein